MTDALSQFDAALTGGKINDQRGADYGHPLDDFSRIGKLWGAILDIDPVPAEAVALCMEAVKISRLSQSPDHTDSIIDIAGYARCHAMILTERAARAERVRERPDPTPNQETHSRD